MSLTDENESDLLGLVSGFGTPESDARARRLAETNTEAAEYLRRMKTIAGAYQSLGDDNIDERLPPEEVDKITDTVYRRWRSRRLRRVITPLGAAAAVLMIALGVAWKTMKPNLPSESPAVGNVSFIPSVILYGSEDKPNQIKEVFAGTEIVTGNELARITFFDETVVVLSKDTKGKICEDGNSLILRKGNAFIRTPVTMMLHLGDSETTLEAGEMIMSMTDEQLTWDVYKGIARITIGGESHEVTAGQRVRWDRTRHMIWIVPFDGVVPDWVKRGLQEGQNQ